MLLLDVRPDHFKIVQDILQKQVPEREVWAFGSRAKWLAKEYSDLDLCIVGETPLSFSTLGLLKETFENSDLPYKVDVVDWATTSESFRKIIERDRVVVRACVMTSTPPEIRLAEIVAIKGGKRLPAGKNLQSTPSKHPYIRVRDVGQRTLPREGIEYVPDDVFPSISRYIVQENDVVLSIVGTIGALSIVDKFYDCASLTENCVKLTGLDYYDALYLYYYLSSRLGQQEIAQGTVGAVQPKLPIYNIEEIKVLWPADKEKRRIFSDVLGRLDDKIDLNRRINQTLEAMAQAIFKSWFVDFDPVKAKIAAIAEGRDPLRAAMSAISGKPDAELDALPTEQYAQLAATAALFPDEMEESELGEIPKGWACGSLGDICSFTAGSAFKPEHQGSTEGDYPFIKVSDMNLAGNEVFIQSANNYVSKAQQSEMKAKLHPLGATVFAKIGVALISNRRRLLTSPTIIDNNLMSASPVEGKSGQYFLYSLLSTLDFNTLVSGTALPYINVSDLKKIPIVRPPYDACHAFEAKASSFFSMMQTLAAHSSTLAATRDALLPKLLSGEIEASGIFEG